MPKVSFSYADKHLHYSFKKAIKSFIPFIFSTEGKVLASLQYIFCSDEYLLDINKRFLQHDYFTDIITFNLSDKTGTVGEVYISLDRVAENAKALLLPFSDELIRVIFHGALHLCGYKDKKKSEIERMRNREEHYMRLYLQNLP